MSSNFAQIYIKKVQLYNYRNYPSLAVKAGEGHIVLWGLNGSGKTNFLEALSLLAPGRGLRRAHYKDFIPQSGLSNQVFVHIDLYSSSYGNLSIGTGIFSDENQRKVKINGQFCAAQNLLEYCHLTWLLPTMDSLFIGPASERRKFLDRMVLALNKSHADHVLNYEKAIKARNRLLQEEQKDARYFSAVEQKISQYGVLIAAARLEFIVLLEKIIKDLTDFLPFPQAKLSLLGTLEDSLLTKNAYIVEEEYKQILADNRTRDMAAGRTLIGVHRSDFQVFYGEKNIIASLCSTGEQKALLISLILGHIYLIRAIAEVTPFVLLDEVAAHLDAQRREALFSMLDSLGVQAIMTGTDRFLFESLKSSAFFYEVKAGKFF